MLSKGWLVALGLILSSSVNAITVNFDLIDPVSVEGARGRFASALNYEVDGVNLHVTGWSSGGNRFNPFARQSRASLSFHDGLVGVERRGLSHSIDNFGFDYDFLVLDFDREVSLSSVGLGYIGADSDLSLGTINSYGYLGFTENIFNASLGTNNVASEGVVASRWLIGAFNPLFGSAQDAFSDAFKINEFSVNVNPVPLPAAFWFFATGLLAFGYYRRKAVAEA